MWMSQKNETNITVGEMHSTAIFREYKVTTFSENLLRACNEQLVWNNYGIYLGLGKTIYYIVSGCN